MTREDFYHSKPITFLQRLVSIGYGICGCCGMPWNFVKKHGRKHIIMINKYEGFFPVCEYCWTHKSYKQNKSAVTELLGKWGEQGVRHYDPNVYINAFENDWNQTHSNKMEEKITAWIARNKDNSLLIYIGECPYKTDCDWSVTYRDGVYIQELDSNSYLQVKWEDEEPNEVELIIKMK